MPKLRESLFEHEVDKEEISHNIQTTFQNAAKFIHSKKQELYTEIQALKNKEAQLSSMMDVLEKAIIETENKLDLIRELSANINILYDRWNVIYNSFSGGTYDENTEHERKALYNLFMRAKDRLYFLRTVPKKAKYSEEIQNIKKNEIYESDVMQKVEKKFDSCFIYLNEGAAKDNLDGLIDLFGIFVILYNVDNIFERTIIRINIQTSERFKYIEQILNELKNIDKHVEFMKDVKKLTDIVQTMPEKSPKISEELINITRKIVNANINDSIWAYFNYFISSKVSFNFIFNSILDEKIFSNFIDETLMKEARNSINNQIQNRKQYFKNPDEISTTFDQMSALIELIIRILIGADESKSVIDAVSLYKNMFERKKNYILNEYNTEESFIEKILLERINKSILDENFYTGYGALDLSHRYDLYSSNYGMGLKICKDIRELLGLEHGNIISENSKAVINNILISVRASSVGLQASTYYTDKLQKSEKADTYRKALISQTFKEDEKDLANFVMKALYNNKVILNYVFVCNSGNNSLLLVKSIAKMIKHANLDINYFNGLMRDPIKFILSLKHMQDFENYNDIKPMINYVKSKVNKKDFLGSIKKLSTICKIIHNNYSFGTDTSDLYSNYSDAFAIVRYYEKDRNDILRWYDNDDQRMQRDLQELDERHEQAKKIVAEIESRVEEKIKPLKQMTFENKNFKNINYNIVQKYFTIGLKIKDYAWNDFYSEHEYSLKKMQARNLLNIDEIEKQFNFIKDSFDKNIEINTKDPNVRNTISTFLDFLNVIKDQDAYIKYYDKIEEKIPELFALNKNYGEYRFRVLDTGNVAALNEVGNKTNCCQAIGGAGEGAAIDSFINSNAGVLLLEAQINGEYEIVAQSYFHYVPEDKGYILDNVETSNLASNIDINVFYAKLAKDIVEEGAKYFWCGTRYNKLNSQFFGHGSSKKEDPRKFSHDSPYTDFSMDNYLDLTKAKSSQVSKKKPNRQIEEVPLDFSVLQAGYKDSFRFFCIASWL